MILEIKRLTARVSGLVGEPTIETEKSIRLDSSICHGPPPSPLHPLLGGFYFFRFYLAFHKLHNLVNCFAIPIVDANTHIFLFIRIMKN